MQIIRDYFLTAKPWISLMIIAGCFAIWIILKKALSHIKFHDDSSKQHAAHLQVGARILKYAIAVIAVITVLQINGVNVTSLVTGLGVAGVVVGFALEDLLKDIVSGTSIVAENYFVVGDMVCYHSPSGKTIEGKVTEFNLKITRIFDVVTGNTVTISNRNISEIEKMSDWLGITVPSPYSVPAEKMRTVCKEICKRIQELPDVTACDFIGTDEFAASQISYKILMYCNPETKKRRRYDAMGIIQDTLNEFGIEVPFNRLDVTLFKD